MWANPFVPHTHHCLHHEKNAFPATHAPLYRVHAPIAMLSHTDFCHVFSMPPYVVRNWLNGYQMYLSAHEILHLVVKCERILIALKCMCSYWEYRSHIFLYVQNIFDKHISNRSHSTCSVNVVYNSSSNHKIFGFIPWDSQDLLYLGSQCMAWVYRKSTWR